MLGDGHKAISYLEEGIRKQGGGSLALLERAGRLYHAMGGHEKAVEIHRARLTQVTQPLTPSP